MLSVRVAEKSDMEWINSQYDQIGFVHSNFEKEIIAIAEIGEQKVGIGRVVKIDEQCAELGGIYVFPAFRNQGIAHVLVSFLLKQQLSQKLIYCIPFVPLVSFYSQYGFKSIEDGAYVPQSLRNKYKWCHTTYPTPTTLMILAINN